MDDYKEEIRQCYAVIKELSRDSVTVYILTGANTEVVDRTLDMFRIMMADAWERLGYGPFTDFIKSKGLRARFLAMKETP